MCLQTAKNALKYIRNFVLSSVSQCTKEWQYLSGFRIQSEILTNFRILQLQRIVDSSIFGPGFWTLGIINLDYGEVSEGRHFLFIVY